VDQEQYLNNRMKHALRIADELNFMIEHTLGIHPNKQTTEILKNLGNVGISENPSQGKKLYKLMKDFLDLSTQHNEDGTYSDEIINKYLEDMSEFSFNPKVDNDVFEFSIQDHIYKVEVIMQNIVGMTLFINDEWVQTRIVKNENDFSAVMRILDNMKGMYETNPYLDKKPFVQFYNKVVRVANQDAPEWKNVEKKVFVPYSGVNDVYLSPYNSEEFMSDLFKILAESKGKIDEVSDKSERQAIEKYIDFLLRCKKDFSINNLTDLAGLSDVIYKQDLNYDSSQTSKFFHEIIRKLSKKHNTLNRLKELADELKTFSDVKTVDEHTEEAEREYGYEAVKQYLDDNNKEVFLRNAVLMTPINSVNIAKYISLQTDEYIFDRADLMLELTTRYVVPLQTDDYKRIFAIISSDPVNLLRKYDPVLTNSIFGDKEYVVADIDMNLFNDIVKDAQKVEQAQEVLKDELSEGYKSITKEVLEEMDELVAQGKIEKKDPENPGDIPDYFQEMVDRAVLKLVDSGLIQKVIEESMKK